MSKPHICDRTRAAIDFALAAVAREVAGDTPVEVRQREELSAIISVVISSYLSAEVLWPICSDTSKIDGPRVDRIFCGALAGAMQNHIGARRVLMHGRALTAIEQTGLLMGVLGKELAARLTSQAADENAAFVIECRADGTIAGANFDFHDYMRGAAK